MTVIAAVPGCFAVRRATVAVDGKIHSPLHRWDFALTTMPKTPRLPLRLRGRSLRSNSYTTSGGTTGDQRLPSEVTLGCGDEVLTAGKIPRSDRHGQHDGTCTAGVSDLSQEDLPARRVTMIPSYVH